MEMNRVNELMASMKSFGKEAYYRSELLDEMFALQREIVALTFNEDHASTADLRIWDVERHLEQMNQDCGNVADEELGRFEEGCKNLATSLKLKYPEEGESTRCLELLSISTLTILSLRT